MIVLVNYYQLECIPLRAASKLQVCCMLGPLLGLLS